METRDEPVTTAEVVQPEAGLDLLLPVPVCTLPFGNSESFLPNN